MKKRNEILIFFILILAIASIAYFKIIKVNDINKNTADNEIALQEEKKEEINLVEIENSYTEEIKNILSDYDKEIKNQISEQGLLNDEQSRLDLLGKIIDLKERLLKLKVPTYFKALHLNLVLAFSKMESFIVSRIDEERINGLHFMEKAKSSQNWLE